MIRTRWKVVRRALLASAVGVTGLLAGCTDSNKSDGQIQASPEASNAAAGDRQELWREHDQEIRQPDEEEAIIGALFRSFICHVGTPVAGLHPGAAPAPVSSWG